MGPARAGEPRRQAADHEGAADLDLRGSAGRSRAVREAVLLVLAGNDGNAATIGVAARAAMLAGDPTGTSSVCGQLNC